MMLPFIEALKGRNESLFWFGALHLGLAVVFLALAALSKTQVMGVNAWYKPAKFAISIGVYAWTMAWYLYYLEAPGLTRAFNWIIVLTLGFETAYIAIQAARGQLSHFNLSTPLYGALYVGMASAATAVSLATAYVGILFFQREFPNLPLYYVWAIRLGIVLFVVFSLEGFVMGSRLSHTIGGPDGGKGLPFLNWSYRYGDPRVAHFIGMHALQVLPVLAYWVLRDLKWTLLIAFLYAALAVWTLWAALQGKPGI